MHPEAGLLVDSRSSQVDAQVWPSQSPNAIMIVRPNPQSGDLYCIPESTGLSTFPLNLQRLKVVYTNCAVGTILRGICLLMAPSLWVLTGYKEARLNVIILTNDSDAQTPAVPFTSFLPRIPPWHLGLQVLCKDWLS